MPHISVGDARFYTECQGKGTPLVLIAGYSCDHTFWDPLYDTLTQHYQVLRFDNRGIGQSQDEGMPFHLDTLADDTLQIIKALGLTRPIILGQSMGGAIAQCLAKKYPTEVSKLILLNTSSKISRRTLWMLESLLKLVKASVPIDTIIDMSLPLFFSSTFLSNPQQVEAYKARLLNNPFPATLTILERQFNALQTFDAQGWIKGITLPTLVIASTEDIICSPEESEDLAHSIPQARLERIAGGHSSPFDNPQAINALIRGFI